MKITYTLTEMEYYAAQVGASFYSRKGNVLSYIMPDGQTLVQFKEIYPAVHEKI